MICIPFRRHWWMAVLGLTVAIVGLLAFVSLAQAHALLVRSIPEANAELSTPPQAIEMWFSEPLEARFSNARLVASTGEEVPTGAAMVDGDDPTHMTLPLADLPPGIYTVVWQTLSSVDGHEWIGSFPITVLNADGTRPAAGAAAVAGSTRGELPLPLEAVARLVSLWGAVFLFGVAIFWALVIRPIRTPPHAGGSGAQSQLLNNLAKNSLSVGLIIGAVAVLLGGWLQVGVQALSLGSITHLPDLLLDTRPGNLVLYREVLAGAILLLILSTMEPARRGWGRWWLGSAGLYTLGLLVPVIVLAAENPQPLPLLVFGGSILAAGMAWLHLRQPTSRWTPLTLGTTLILSTAVLLAFSLGSHAAAAPGRGWAVLGDWLHLAAAAAWLGGLLMLAVLLWRVHRRLHAIDSTMLAAMVRRFSYLAGASVFVLAITGLFSSLVQLSTLDALWTTAYGWVLLVKLALVALALGLALLNNRMSHRETWEPQTGMRRFLRQILSESAVGIAILIVVAVLVQTPVPQASAPATAFAANTFNDIVAADDLLIHMQVDPNQVGNNRFWTHLYHADGSSIGDVQLVRLFFVHQEQDLGQARIDLEPLGQDTFAAEGAYLNQGGMWDLSIYVRRRGMDDLLTNVTVDVSAPTGATAASDPWQNPVTAFPGGMVIGGVLMSLGLIPILWFRALRRNRWVSYPALATIGALCLIAGVGIGYTATPTAASPAEIAGTPLPVTDASIVAGSEQYQTLCADCHGPYGLGNGPAAASLPVPPAVLIFHVPEHEDAELYAFISKGFPALGMPAFGEQLSHEEIWQIVHYLRNEFGPLASQ